MTECCEICGEPFLVPEHRFEIRGLNLARPVEGFGHPWCVRPAALLRHLREARVQLAQGGGSCLNQPLSTL